MKKRIIGMILVVVMLTLSLVSCGYSFRKDDMSKYASLSEEDKAAFLAALQSIVIEDGDFTSDEAIRKDKVLDYIYESIMSTAADTTDQKTEGVPGAHDKVHYFYYMTADFDGTEAVFSLDTMKGTASNLLLGLSDYDDEVKTAIAEGLSKVDFKDKVYKTTTTGKTSENNIAFVSYSYSYSVTDAEGKVSAKEGKVINTKIIVGAKPAEGAEATSLASYLCGKDIAKTLDKVVINEADKGAVTYSNIIVNWTANIDTPAVTFQNTTYTESKTFTDTQNVARDVNGKSITYHIFPTYFVPTPEYTMFNLIDLYYGEDISVESLYTLILGEEYSSLDEKEDAAKIEERIELLKDYKTADGDSVETFAGKLKDLYKDITDTETAKESASEDVSEAQKTRDEAETKLNDEKAKETPDSAEITRLEGLLATAEEALAKAKTANETANKNHEDKKTEKTNYINSFLAIQKDSETFDTYLKTRFDKLTYQALQEEYNEEIRMNLAKEVYYFLTTNIKLGDKLPEDAVKMTYESLMENYETSFYTDDYSDNQSNYNKYKKFETFLIQQVKTDYGETVTTYKEAKAVVMKEAEEYVKPIVKIYLAAQIFDLKVSDKEYKEYKENPDNEYEYNIYYYGENSVLHAYQLDKILDYFVEFEESEPVTDANGYEFIKYEFKKIGAYTIGDPASEAETTEETAE